VSETSANGELDEGTFPHSLQPDIDRDRRLAVFTDFWFMAVRYQIVKDLTDHCLAIDVFGLSDKTVGNWRNCIVASGSIVKLIQFIDELPTEMKTVNCTKVRQALDLRLRELAKPLEEAVIKWGSLPKFSTFKNAVNTSIETVLTNFVMDLDPKASSLAVSSTASHRSKAVARNLADDLIWLFEPSKISPLKIYREELERRLAVVSQISSRLSLHRVISAQVFEDEDADAIVELAAAVIEAEREAKSYVSKLYARVLAGDEFSERASFRARLSSGQPLYKSTRITDPSDPFHPDKIEKAKEAEFNALCRLIAVCAEIRVS